MKGRVFNASVVPESFLPILLTVIFCSIVLISSEQIYVSTNGTDSTLCGDVYTPCASPTQAVKNSSPQDTIMIFEGTYEIQTPIDILFDLTIQAESNNTVNLYSSSCTILIVHTSGTVNLIGVNIINSTVAPVIQSANSILIEQCVFQNNQFNISSSGLLLALNGSQITISNTQIIQNTLIINNTYEFSGTFIQIFATTVQISNFIFKENQFINKYPWDSFIANGGFIFLQTITTTMINCTWEKNLISIQNAVLLNGGITLIESSNTSMTNCAFIGNSLEANPLINSGLLSGAAISISQLSYSNVSLNNLSFTNNLFKFCGGNITGGVFYSPTSAYADSLSFVNNTIEYSPSGNFINGGLSFLGQYYTLHNSQFINNHLYPLTNITNMNTSCLTEAVQGVLTQAAIDDIQNLVVTNNSFTMLSSPYCYSGQVTGLFHIFSLYTLSISSSIFENNIILGGDGLSGSNIVGGCMVLQGSLGNTIQNCSFSNNTIVAGSTTTPLLIGSGAAGSAFGGALVITGNSSILNCQFSGNTAKAGIPQHGDCNITTNLPVSRVPGSALGGAVYVDGDWLLQISNCSFSYNMAISPGYNNCAEVNSSSILPCKGGTIYSEYLEIDNSLIENSFCDYCRGGAIYSNQLSLNNTNITSNYIVSGMGGAIYLTNFTTVDEVKTRRSNNRVDNLELVSTFDTVYLSNNTVEFGLGGVLFIDQIYTLNISDVYIESNSASHGGGIYYQSFPQILTFDNFYMYDNEAQVAGGAIFIATFDEFEHLLTAPQINNQTMLLTPKLFSSSYFASDMKNNSAELYGGDCASSIFSLLFKIPPPDVAWPGKKFASSLILVDIFNNTVISPDFEVTVVASDPLKFSSGVPQDTVKVREQTGSYNFPASMLLSTPGELIELVYTAQYSTFSFPVFVKIMTASCPPGYQYSNSICYPCSSSEYNFNGEECLECPFLEGEIPKECMIPPSTSTLKVCESGDLSCYYKHCNELRFSVQDCSDMISGEISIVQVSQGYWPVPSENLFINPSSLVLCENCQPFICTLQWNRTVQSYEEVWNINCSIAFSSEDNIECELNPLDSRCCLGYTNRLCSQCVSGYYASDEECVECSTKWYSSFWMVIVDFVVVVAFIILGIIFRNNLIALCVEIVVVVFFYLLGIGSLFSLVFLILVFAVLFITNSAVREGVLKSLIFYFQTCNLLLPGLFKWSVSGTSLDIEFISRNGLECYFGWFSSIVGFWFVMLLPLLILILCILVWIIGQQIYKVINLLPIRINSKVRNSSNSSKHDFEDPHHIVTPLEKWSCIWIKICLFLWYIIYYDVSNRILENYLCVPEEQGEASYLEASPWIQCTTDTSKSPYLFSLLIPSIIFTIIYIIGYPLLLFLILFTERKKMHSKRTELMFGFLYENFKHSFWWFEVLLIGRRILISIALTNIPDTVPLGKQMVLIILVTFLLIFLFARPYHARDEVDSEIVSTVSILLLITTGMNYQTSGNIWLSWMGLSIYVLTMLYLVCLLIYPQLRKITKLKQICLGILHFLKDHFVDDSIGDRDYHSDSSEDNKEEIELEDNVNMDSVPLLLNNDGDLSSIKL